MTWKITTKRREDFGDKIFSNVQPQQWGIMHCRRNSDFLTWLIGCDGLIGTNTVWNEGTSRLIFKGKAYYFCGLPAMVAFMRYVMQSSKHLSGPSKKSIRITCSRTAETWREELRWSGSHLASQKHVLCASCLHPPGSSSRPVLHPTAIAETWKSG